MQPFAKKLNFICKKFDLLHFNGPQAKFIVDCLYEHPVDNQFVDIIWVDVKQVNLYLLIFVCGHVVFAKFLCAVAARGNSATFIKPNLPVPPHGTHTIQFRYITM